MKILKSFMRKNVSIPHDQMFFSQFSLVSPQLILDHYATYRSTNSINFILSFLNLPIMNPNIPISPFQPYCSSSFLNFLISTSLSLSLSLSLNTGNILFKCLLLMDDCYNLIFTSLTFSL